MESDVAQEQESDQSRYDDNGYNILENIHPSNNSNFQEHKFY